jgi:DNA-binding beta-propeller fold protein YncE
MTDGECAPFVTIDVRRWRYPTGLAFSPDGKTMLVGTTQPASEDPAGPPKKGAGKILLVEAPTLFGSLDFAPAGFGPYVGQLFVVDVGHYEIPVPLGQALRADGKAHRVTPEGKLELVASGFINPWGLRFGGNTLWVSDIKGDFIYGKRKLPDGFIVAIEAQ